MNSESHNKETFSPDAWGAPTEEVSITELDEAVKAFQEARLDYEQKKKISNEADAVCKEAKKKLYNLLQAAGKKSWEVEGVGKVSKYETFSFKTPKAPTEKQALAKYMQDKYGKDVFWEMFSVNSMSLNSWANQEFENDPSLAKIPGLEDPVANEKIRFNTSRSKK